MNRNHFYIHTGFNDDIMGLELQSDYDIDRQWEEFVEYERIKREDSSHTSPVPTSFSRLLDADQDVPF